VKKKTAGGNVVRKFIENAERNPEKPAIIHHTKELGHATVSYGELVRGVEVMAERFRGRGIGKGDRVVVFIPMSIELYRAVLALFYIGAVAVFIDAWGGIRRLNQACEIAGPKGFIGSPKAQILMLASHLRRVAVKMIEPQPFAYQRKKMDDTIARPAGNAVPEHLNDEDEALVTFTTGSTGRPKAARRTHGFLRVQHEVLTRSLGLERDDVDLTTLPIFLLNNLAAGITSVIPRFDPARPGEVDAPLILDQIKRFSVTTSAGSPAFYEGLAADLLETGRRVYMRKLFVGGAPVYPANAKMFRDAFPGAEVLAVYGSTEAEPISELPVEEVIASDVADGLPVGRKIRDVELRIIRPVDGPVEPGAKGLRGFFARKGDIGEIILCGPHVLKEYLNSPEDFRMNKIVDGKKIWHRTGDAGRLAEDGSLFFYGRVKNRIAAGSGSVYTLPLEIALRGINGVTAAALIEVHGGACAFLETRSGLPRAREEYIAGTAKKMLRSHGDIAIQLIDRIPRDPRHNSKVDYDKLRKIFG